MAVRIYSLAKELKFDSKELVDLCAKAGINGKGSALASLTDEEVVKLKAYLSSRSRPAAADRPVAAVDRPLERPADLGVEREIKVLAPPPRTKLAPKPAPLAPPPTPPAPVVVPAEGRSSDGGPDSPDQSASSTRGTSPLGSRTKKSENQDVAASASPDTDANSASTAGSDTTRSPSTELRREDYIGPGGTAGRTGSMGRAPLEGRRRGGGSSGGAGTSRPQRTGPAIKLAPMPTAKQPSNRAAANEPAPQKPDLKLPIDAIRAGRSGATPLSEHIRKHDEKRKADKAKGKTDAPAAGAKPADTLASRGRKASKGAVPQDGEFKSALGGREARQLSRKRAVPVIKKVGGDEDEVRIRRRSTRRPKRTGTNTAAPRKTKVVLQLPATVRSFSEAVGVPASQVLGKLLALGGGMGLNIATALSADTIELLAVELGVELEVRRMTDVEDTVTDLDSQIDSPESLVARPPVITFLGHVDHGKTSLIDRIIGLKVAAGESGGITQHIRAYQADHKGRKISFVDTPGHEAFTEMRARGANVTDIAVLVVAADDGVMPQTEEAISHARAAEVPIVVALNKIDLPGVNIEHIYQQLATAGLLPTEWGGDVEVVKTSAQSGQGIDDLLETLFTIAELHELQANPNRPAVGTCLEAEIHEGRGVIAKLMVLKGTLRVGDAIVCGTTTGHIKAMYDTLNRHRKIKEAGPSVPVNVTGLDQAPAAGEHFYVLESIGKAREIAAQREILSREATLGSAPVHVTLENLHERLSEQRDAVKSLNIILRADVRGSIEALLKEFTKLEHPEVKIKVLQATVGGISEADIHLADASDAVVIGFNVVPDDRARALADQRGVQVRRYEIIYKVTEDLRSSLEGMLRPEERETEVGRALVLRTFTISRIGTIAGCRVLSGNISRNSRVRIIRENRIIGDYGLDSLKREKDDARDVREGLECGIKLAGFNDIKEGDILEAYKIEEVARTF
ncbi:MAG: translation initiation factor IF-2 [Planctomycetota bacterium]|nr:translation initiation factor IF-2 [Planctomycetota bacterium]